MDSNQITEAYFDRILLKSRLIDSDLPDMTTEFLGETFETPIMTAALSHLHTICPNGMEQLASAAKRAGAVYFCGMTEDDEIERIVATGARVASIIKPHEKNEEVIRQIRHNVEIGVFAVGVDIDHAYNGNGGYDVVTGYSMKSKSLADMKLFVEAAGDVPFIVKGVLSVEDAEKCVEMGAKAIIVSHHHGIQPSSVPPLMVLPEIKKAVGDKLTIIVDCCLDSGVDVFKALALGADAVCIGRALMDPLHEGEEQGAYEAIMKLTNELKSVTARCGYKAVKDIDDKCVVIV